MEKYVGKVAHVIVNKECYTRNSFIHVRPCVCCHNNIEKSQKRVYIHLVDTTKIENKSPGQ